MSVTTGEVRSIGAIAEAIRRDNVVKRAQEEAEKYGIHFDKNELSLWEAFRYRLRNDRLVAALNTAKTAHVWVWLSDKESKPSWRSVYINVNVTDDEIITFLLINHNVPS